VETTDEPDVHRSGDSAGVENAVRAVIRRGSRP
jgi:hypothetical protein